MTQETMPEAFDRRNANRDAASWVRRELEAQTKAIGDTRLDIVIGLQHVENRIEHIDSKVEHLHKTLLSAVPNGDPVQHLEDHVLVAAERLERKEADEDTKKFRKDIIYKAKMALVLGAVSLFLLGAADWMRNFVLGVEQGRTAQELVKAEPVKQPDRSPREETKQDHDRQYHRFSR